MKAKILHPAKRPLAAAEDDLLRLEMRIAQRADQLWKSEGKARSNGLQHWLRAEREIISAALVPA